MVQDLLKHTPKDHPDFPLLQDALRISQNFLSSINEEIDPRRTAVTTPKGEVCVIVCKVSVFGTFNISIFNTCKLLATNTRETCSYRVMILLKWLTPELATGQLGYTASCFLRWNNTK